MQIWPKLYLCICVFVFLYLHVRHLGTLFSKSSYHYLFKNISHVWSIWSFDPNCFCVFVYLHLCIWVSDTWEHCFWGPRTIFFLKIYHIMGLFRVFLLQSYKWDGLDGISVWGDYMRLQTSHWHLDDISFEKRRTCFEETVRCLLSAGCQGRSRNRCYVNIINDQNTTKEDTSWSSNNRS